MAFSSVVTEEKLFAAVDGETKGFFDQLGLQGTIDKIWELCYLHALR